MTEQFLHGPDVVSVLEQIATWYHQRLGLTLTRGAIVRALHRTARLAAPTYAALGRTIRGSPMVAPDETGWRVHGRLHGLWAFATPDTTVYAIHAGRGFPASPKRPRRSAPTSGASSCGTAGLPTVN